MKWEKKGLIYCANKDSEWRYQWAHVPTPIEHNGKIRCYITFVNKDIIGRIGYIDLNPDNPSEILEISENPVFDLGEAGCFDDNGVAAVSVMKVDNEIRLYYIGYQKGVKIPYYMFCGLAISKDGEHFERYSKTPVLDRKGDEIYARCGVNVIKDKDKYRAYYIGSYKEGWTMSQGKLKPLYIMKTTTSDDGLHWYNDSIQCMEYQNEDEHGFGRPYVWFEDGIYKMYFCIRTYSRGYYIAYAESDDAINWVRKDAGIDLSESGWDNENMSYPYLYRYKNKIYMFYNGNGCGKTGFGYAQSYID